MQKKSPVLKGGSQIVFSHLDLFKYFRFLCLTNCLQTGCNCLLVTFSCLVSSAKIHQTYRNIFHFRSLLDDVRQGRTKQRNCRLGLYDLYPQGYAGVPQGVRPVRQRSHLDFVKKNIMVWWSWLTWERTPCRWHPYYVTGKVRRIFTAQNKSCVQGIQQPACSENSQVCSLEFQCLIPPLSCSLTSGVVFLLVIKTIYIKYFQVNRKLFKRQLGQLGFLW